MTVAAADLCKAVNAVWDASALDATFKGLWAPSVVEADWEVLHDGSGFAEGASAGQPFPYVVFDQPGGGTTDRMSSKGAFVREIRDMPFTFRVHARAIAGDVRTAKQVAADLAEEVMKVFGGHPVTHPAGLTLDNGNFLITRYVNDYGVRTGEDEHLWTIAYSFRIDVPVSV